MSSSIETIVSHEEMFQAVRYVVICLSR